MCAGTPTVINVSLLIYLLVNYYNTTVFDELDNKSLGTSDQWLIKKIERGEAMYQRHRHLLQMHTTDYMPFTWENVSY